jgi:hypothetical protein
VAALHFVVRLAHDTAGCRAHWPPATDCWAMQCIRASARRRSATSIEASRGGKASAQMTGIASTCRDSRSLGGGRLDRARRRSKLGRSTTE